MQMRPLLPDISSNLELSYPTKQDFSTTIISLLCVLLVFSVSGVAFLPPFTAHAAHAVAANVATLTYKNDNARTGQYSDETILNTANVTVAQFGKRVTYPVDGQVYAQPLYMPNLTINGTIHNVVFVATEHDSIYAFDADQTTVQPALWHTSFLTHGATSVPYTLVACNDTKPELGITSTPVIDRNTNTMYAVAYTLEDGREVYRLHALNVTTGLEQAGSPSIIRAAVPGKGSGSVHGTITFNPLKERQRSALLQANGQIYVAFASFCDNSPYEGWILRYTYNGSAFLQTKAYSVAANGLGGGIWGSGSGISADSSGNIYAATGNGDFNLNTGGTEASDSFIKLNADLQVQDYMTPFNQSCLQQRDTDLGSGGPLILSSSNRMIGVGKEGRIYVLDSNHMGNFVADPTLNCKTPERLRSNVDNVLQEFPPATVGGIYSNPAFWNGANGQQYVYFSGSGDHTKAFRWSNGRLSTIPTSQTPESFTFTGGNAIISSNGTMSGTGILWVIDPHAVLRAYDATNLARELYNSNQYAKRDALDSYVKFSAPTVANGKVFVPTSDTLTIYGRKPFIPSIAVVALPPLASSSLYNNTGISSDATSATSAAANFDFNNASYSQQALQTAGINPGDNAFYNGMVFTWPDAVAATLDNYIANGQVVPVNSLTNATTLGFLGSASGGSSSGIATINYTDGTTQPYTLSFSDWTLNGGSGAPAFGNGTAITTSYRNIPGGKQVINTYVFYAAMAIPAGKTVQSVTLPVTVDHGVLHVFAIATKQAAH